MPIARDIFEPDRQPTQRHDQSSGLYNNQHGNSDILAAPSQPPSQIHSPIEPGQCQESREELIARIKRDRRAHLSRNPINVPRTSPSLLPSPDFDQLKSPVADSNTTLPLVSGIERPKSALHAGDFREQVHSVPSRNGLFVNDTDDALIWTGTSPTDHWFIPSLPASGPTHLFEAFDPSASRPVPAQARSRTASQSSLSSNFVYRPPTSPLARGPETNDLEERTRSRSPTKTSRRRTFSPRAFRTVQLSPPALADSMYSGSGRNITPLRRGANMPYYTHHPRRSITTQGNPPQLSTSQTSPPRTRRKSLLADGSPLQAPMVGGYEESILRGRMSTLPSRPLDFVAQIGVLGVGKCKSSLRCPPHLSIPFPAVFYNYGNYSGPGPSTSGGPSPYVGLIDLENFQNDGGEQAQGHTGHHHPRSPNSDGESNPTSSTVTSNISSHEQKMNNVRCSTSKSHTPGSKRAPPKGGYRIPQQGQLQIVIKNPNKTAVKLFLIPYDLEGMEAGQKTFIRQRSYSAGPIIDMPMSARKNYGTDRPEAALTNSTDPKDRPVLRYLIHLHICCTSRGRFYLYNGIRAVFANRVPDGKEKLRNEIQLPEPRYTTYKSETDGLAIQNSAGRRMSHGQSFEAEIARPSINVSHSLGLSSRLHLSDRPVANPEVNETFSFPRKSLPGAAAEPSPDGSQTSDGSSVMQWQNMADDRRSDAFDVAMEVESSNLTGESDTMSSFDRAPVTGKASKEPPQSPKSGLLSLQLRGLIRKDNSEFDEAM